MAAPTTADYKTYPEGSPNSIEATKLYLSNIMDEIVVASSITGYMTPNATLFQAAQRSGEFSVPTISTQALADYSKAKGFTVGDVSLAFETYKARFDRGRSFNLDAVDVMQQDGRLSATAVMAEFMRAEVVPEIDAVRISTLAGMAITDGNTVSKAPAKASFVSDVMDAIRHVKTGLRLPNTNGIRVHVNESYMSVLEQSSEYTRAKDITAGIRRLDSGVDMINGAELIETPADYMKSAITLNNGTPTVAGTNVDGGWSPASDAVDIAALVVAPGIANGIVAHNVANIFPPGVAQGIDGSKIEYRIFHDCLVLANKRAGLYAITVPAASSGGA